MPKRGGSSASVLQVVQRGGVVPTSRKGRAGGCRSVEQVCSEQGLAGSFPRVFLAGTRQHRQLLSHPKIVLPMMEGDAVTDLEKLLVGPV